MGNSMAGVSRLKPAKKVDWRKARGLHPNFPLFPHGDPDKPDRLRWCKKVRCKLVYFGKVETDPKGVKAQEIWLRDKDDLIAGRTPRAAVGGLLLRDLCNKFLASKRTGVDLGKLSPRTFVEYSRTTDILIETFGKDRPVLDLRPDDFELLYSKLAKKHGLTTLGREVTMVRSVFKYGLESDLIDRAIKFGPAFKSPTKADKRKHKAKQKHANGAKMFQAVEIRSMLNAAGPQLKAMIYLGINAGFGNTDCSSLPLSALDLKAGWIDYPRQKTGIERRIPLWPETVKALTAVIAQRGKAKDPDNAGLVFLTRLGQPWVRYGLAETKDENGNLSIRGQSADSIVGEVAKLFKLLGLTRTGATFYTLRHTFETIAGATADQVAVDAIMGHVDASMAAEYREHIEDSRLKAVVEHVRKWLKAKPAKGVNRG